jgi:hypothetical protein
MTNIKKWFVIGSSALLMAIGVLTVLQPAHAWAVMPNEGGDGTGGTGAPSASDQDVCGNGEACNKFIDTYINPAIRLLTALVGIVAVISIIMAGIQYSSSADDPATVSKAKHRILNTVIGLVAYIFLLAFINYLIPGGFF